MSTDTGKVVVNRAMSLDGFIAGPGHSMDWGGGRAPGWRPSSRAAWNRRSHLRFRVRQQTDRSLG